jgi:hypothetical protein
MHKSLLQTAVACGVGLSSQTHKSLLVNVSSKRIEAGDDYINPKVVLVPSEEMGLGHVLRDKIAVPFAHIIFLAHDSNALPTTHISWLHDVEVLEVTHFSFLLPPLIVFWENICLGAYLKFFPMSAALSVNIPPHVSFAAQTPSSREMVYFLVGVDILEF